MSVMSDNAWSEAEQCHKGMCALEGTHQMLRDAESAIAQIPFKQCALALLESPDWPTAARRLGLDASLPPSLCYVPLCFGYVAALSWAKLPVPEGWLQVSKMIDFAAARKRLRPEKPDAP